MPSRSTVYPDRSSFTVNILAGNAGNDRYDYAPNDQAYDVAVVEFDDDGRLVDPVQLQSASDTVADARKQNPNGAVVVAFIHGWHHGARWDVADGRDSGGDEHFSAFRQVLRSLALREAERYTQTAAGRRVVGVYIAWNGDPRDSFFSHRWLSFMSFRNRYDVASRIGGGGDLREVIRTLVAGTKDSTNTAQGLPAPESPLILIGHSMGGLMVETAFRTMLDQEPQSLVRDSSCASATVEIRQDGKPVSFPDVVIAVNSAADSTIAKAIESKLDRLRLTKEAAADGIRYSPPLLISVTSTVDWATKYLWVAANVHKFWHRTDGHDGTLITHQFSRQAGEFPCQPLGQVDHGQNWHCLRLPTPVGAATPSIPVDLPLCERKASDTDPDLNVPHGRFLLEPLGSEDRARLMWVFQVGKELIEDHNDIFNSKAAALILALIQISGAVMSLASDWTATFEGTG